MVKVEARQPADRVTQLPVHPLGDIGGEAHQLVRRLGVELRIGAQEDEELLERARKAAALHHLLHLGMDPRHLLEADLVDLVGGQVERRDIP